MYMDSFKTSELGSSAFPIAAIYTLVSILVTSALFNLAFRQRLKKFDYLSIALLWTAVFMIGKGDQDDASNSQQSKVLSTTSSSENIEIIVPVMYAFFSSVLYGAIALQWKYVSREYPRLPLAHLTIHASFLYGLFLVPFFIYEMV